MGLIHCHGYSASQGLECNHHMTKQLVSLVPPGPYPIFSAPEHEAQDRVARQVVQHLLSRAFTAQASHPIFGYDLLVYVPANRKDLLYNKGTRAGCKNCMYMYHGEGGRVGGGKREQEKIAVEYVSN